MELIFISTELLTSRFLLPVSSRHIDEDESISIAGFFPPYNSLQQLSDPSTNDGCAIVVRTNEYRSISWNYEHDMDAERANNAGGHTCMNANTLKI